MFCKDRKKYRQIIFLFGKTIIKIQTDPKITGLI